MLFFYNRVLLAAITAFTFLQFTFAHPIPSPDMWVPSILLFELRPELSENSKPTIGALGVVWSLAKFKFQVSVLWGPSQCYIRTETKTTWMKYNTSRMEQRPLWIRTLLLLTTWTRTWRLWRFRFLLLRTRPRRTTSILEAESTGTWSYGPYL